MEKQIDIPLSITPEDVQAVLQVNPLMAAQVENRALKRKLQETTIAFDAAIGETRRLTEELEQSKNGKGAKEK